jgi:hypothetical protein
MPMSPREATRPHRNSADWIPLYSDTDSGCGAGCVGFLVFVFGAVFVSASTAGILAGGVGAALGGTIFLLVGVGLSAMGGRLLLQAIGPRPRLWADKIEVAAGESFSVRWETRGRFKEARSIQITWEGQEVAIERGYNSTSHRATFATRVVTSDIGPPTGTAAVVLQKVLMPSFTAKNARIYWLLRARVQTPRWPNVEEQYRIRVLPNPAERT